ncbi:MAG: flagellin FliC [Magnetococcales bacterium]|nr:flagellin FliC [Magnetococcales bacterium]
MALTVITNLASLNAQRNLGKTTSALSKTYQRLSSGLRVNSAVDDAAGLGISTRFTAEVRGMNMAVRNVNDGISLLQVADGSLDETTNALQRMRELAVQAASGTLTSTDRTNLNAEFSQLLSEVDRIGSNTKFNGRFLLFGSVTAVQVQVGAYSGQLLSITLASATTAALLTAGVQISGTAGTEAMSAITTIDAAIASVASIRATIGSLQSRFESVISTLNNTSVNTSAANSRIMDADIASETANLTRNSILQQAAASILSQANQQPQIALTLLNGR